MHSGHLTAFRFKQTPAARLSVQSSIVSGAWQHIATFKRMSYMTFLACGARPYSIRCHSCIAQCSGAKLNSGHFIIRLQCDHAHSTLPQANTCSDVLNSIARGEI